MAQNQTVWTWRAGQKWHRQPRVWAIIAVLLALGAICGAIINLYEKTEVATDDVIEVDESVIAAEAATQAIQSSIENYCENLFATYQDAGLIASHIEIANARNYWSSFKQLAEYDSQGRSIYRFRWTAYNANTEGDVAVTCYVASDTADSNYLQQFTVDGVLIDGLEYYEIYNSDGELQRDANGYYVDTSDDADGSEDADSSEDADDAGDAGDADSY